jgi:hypothetical protein
MSAIDLLEKHPYVTDVHEWLHERRRFSNIRHPFRKGEFENRILNQVCASLGNAVFDRGESPYPTTGQMLAKPDSLLGYVNELLRSHSSSGQMKVEIKKAWLTPEEKEKFKEKLSALLAEFEWSTSIFGEPVSILSIQTDG